MPAPPGVLTALLDRFHAGGLRELERPPSGARADARLCADRATWGRIGRDVRGGMEAFRRGRLTIRDDLHLGVGFLAATSGMTEPGRLEVGRVGTEIGDIALLRAGAGHPVLLLHG